MEQSVGQRRTLWVDVSALAGWRGNTTGIARTLGQLVRHWLADGQLPVRLCRYESLWQVYLPVDPAPLVRPEAPPAEEPNLRGGQSADSGPGAALFWHRLPENVRDAGWHFYHGAKCSGRVARSGWRKMLSGGRKSLRHLTSKRPGALFTPGDVVFIAGAAWKDSPPPDVLSRLRQEQ